MMRSNKNIPNLLSLSRIGLSFGMFFVAQKPIILFWVIVACGITDVLDGFIARRMHCESDLGARLDSLGDLMFFSALVFYVIRYQMDTVQQYMFGIYSIFLIKTLSLIVCSFKNHTIYSLHTYGNKLTGILVVVAICQILLTGNGTCTAVLVVVAIFSALEELLIMSLYKHPDINVRSIFLIKKKQA
jgi:CDP-diacylglycerol--glycerol-3-phosphate 3-phosphatidyltransferase